MGKQAVHANIKVVGLRNAASVQDRWLIAADDPYFLHLKPLSGLWAGKHTLEFSRPQHSQTAKEN
jgi:hypothetical protein